MSSNESDSESGSENEILSQESVSLSQNSESSNESSAEIPYEFVKENVRIVYYCTLQKKNFLQKKY